MAYTLPLIAPSNFILKLKLHCSKCENKLKRILLAVEGVHSVRIDAKQGTVAISGTVEPSTIMMLLEKGLGRKAELLWEQKNSPSSSTILDGQQNLQIIAESKVVEERFDDPKMVAQLQELSGIQGLKNIQVTYSKTIKLTFNGESKDDLSDKNAEVTVRDGVYTPGGHCHRDGPLNRNVHGIGHHASGYPIGSCNVCDLHNFNGNSYGWQPHICGCVPPPPAAQPPRPGNYSPSAPPLGTSYNYDHHHTPPPPPPPPTTMGYSYTSPFSDDNPSGGCSIL